MYHSFINFLSGTSKQFSHSVKGIHNVHTYAMNQIYVKISFSDRQETEPAAVQQAEYEEVSLCQTDGEHGGHYDRRPNDQLLAESLRQRDQYCTVVKVSDNR